MKSQDINKLGNIYLNMLLEAYNENIHEVGGYLVKYEDDLEDDNIKTFVYIKPPQGKEELVDVSSYRIDDGVIEGMIEFHKRHGRFPTRKDVGGKAPLDAKDMAQLLN